MIPIERLIAYALGEDAPEVEEHIFACTECARTVTSLLSIGAGVRTLLRAGAWTVPVTSSLTKQLAAAGLITRTYHLVPETLVACTVDATDVYTLTSLKTDLSDVDHVDLIMHSALGEHSMLDLPFERAEGRVAYVASAAMLRTMPTCKVTLELRTTSGLLGRYYLDHTKPED